MTYYASKKTLSRYGYNSVLIWMEDISRLPEDVRPEWKRGGLTLFSLPAFDGKTPEQPSIEYLKAHFIKF